MANPRPSKKLVRALFEQAIRLKRALKALKVENANLRRLVGRKVSRG